MDSERTYTTKSGKVLTEADIERMSAEVCAAEESEQLTGYGEGTHRELAAPGALWCANCGGDWPCAEARRRTGAV